MYLVVRRSRPTDETSLVAAAAQVTVSCYVHYRSKVAGRLFDEWLQGVYAKVVLQAGDADWQRLDNIPQVGGEHVRALPPMRRDERESFLRRLRLYSPPSLEVGPSTTPEWGIALVINAALDMSLGKTMAQAAHAALRSHLQYPNTGWLGRGQPLGIYQASGQRWQGLKRRPHIAICDAGRTELTPGSETVLALPPQELGGLDITPWRGTAH